MYHAIFLYTFICLSSEKKLVYRFCSTFLHYLLNILAMARATSTVARNGYVFKLCCVWLNFWFLFIVPFMFLSFFLPPMGKNYLVNSWLSLTPPIKIKYIHNMSKVSHFFFFLFFLPNPSSNRIWKFVHV